MSAIYPPRAGEEEAHVTAAIVLCVTSEDQALAGYALGALKTACGAAREAARSIKARPRLCMPSGHEARDEIWLKGDLL